MKRALTILLLVTAMCTLFCTLSFATVSLNEYVTQSEVREFMTSCQRVLETDASKIRQLCEQNSVLKKLHDQAESSTTTAGG